MFHYALNMKYRCYKIHKYYLIFFVSLSQQLILNHVKFMILSHFSAKAQGLNSTKRPQFYSYP